MQLIFPLSLPPLQNAASPQGLLSVVDTRLTQVRTALQAAGLHRAKLKTRIAESDQLQNALAHELWLQQHFSLARPDLAQSLVCQAGLSKTHPIEANPARRIWLLRPVHLSLALDHLLLSADAKGTTEIDDPAQWLRLLGEALEPEWTLDLWISPRREVFFTLETPSQIDWAPKSSTQAMGRSIDRYLPTGRDARAWRRFLNHGQMLLHEHPLNAQREALGQARINGLWLEGEHCALPQNLFRSGMKELLQSELLANNTKGVENLTQTKASLHPLDEPIILIDDWLAPTQQGDLEGWTDCWQDFSSFVRALPGRAPITWHFFGEAAVLSMVSQVHDRFRFWRQRSLL
jgi:hypothetical protein